MQAQHNKSGNASARKEDLNGWVEIKGNPISKIGVFPYLGKQIDPAHKDRSISQDTIYNVYRPEEELADKECLDSFRLVPIVDEHDMLGPSDRGYTPAEEKIVHGTIGENVYFDGGYLKANLKIFSEKLAGLIKQGKKELSIGYKCGYDAVLGVFDGKEYQFIQRKIRGNHLALVDNGRSGADVAVLDHFVVTLDTQELMMEEENMQEVNSISEELIEKIAEKVAQKLTEKKEAVAESLDEYGCEKKDADAEDADEKKEDAPDDKADKKAEDEDEKTAAMDKALVQEITKSVTDEVMRSIGKKISARDKLASELSVEVGTFDSANMTVDEVVRYGLKKLGVAAEKGTEYAVLSGYLQGKKAASEVPAQDAGVVKRTRDIHKLMTGKA